MPACAGKPAEGGRCHAPLDRDEANAIRRLTRFRGSGAPRGCGRSGAVGRRAERSLYDYDLATYEAEDAFRHEDAAGFVRLWGRDRRLPDPRLALTVAEYGLP